MLSEPSYQQHAVAQRRSSYSPGKTAAWPRSARCSLVFLHLASVNHPGQVLKGEPQNPCSWDCPQSWCCTQRWALLQYSTAHTSSWFFPIKEEQRPTQQQPHATSSAPQRLPVTSPTQASLQEGASAALTSRAARSLFHEKLHFILKFCLLRIKNSPSVGLRGGSVES